MNIERIGNFYIDTEERERLSIGIETANLDSCIKEAKDKNAIAVFGSPSFGFKQSNIDFLSELPQIESVWFWDVKLDNIDGIYSLKKLKKFGIHPKRPGIDFSNFKDLEKFIWEYNKKDTGISQLKKVKLFHIWHFNPKSKSYDELQVPVHVEELQINWANPESLEGIPTLPKLTCFEIHRCRNLKTIEILPIIAPILNKLVITTSKNVEDAHDVVKKCPNLRFASVNGTILIDNGVLQ